MIKTNCSAREVKCIFFSHIFMIFSQLEANISYHGVNIFRVFPHSRCYRRSIHEAIQGARHRSWFHAQTYYEALQKGAPSAVRLPIISLPGDCREIKVFTKYCPSGNKWTKKLLFDSFLSKIWEKFWKRHWFCGKIKNHGSRVFLCNL